MSKLKISELFYSIQGEGRFMGVPSVFLRTFGCNFKCAGFGMPKGELSKEVEDIAARVHYYDDYKKLPLVKTGCDSYASWDSRFKDLSPVRNSEELAETMTAMLPHKRWMDEHLVITGGEPLLGWQRSYPELLSHDKMKGLQEITFETNGTQELTSEFGQYLYDWQKMRAKHSVTFSISPKLSISGEKWEEAIIPEVVNQYQQYGFVYLKFVVATEDDVKEAEQAVAEYKRKGFKGHVYLMPCGGVESLYNMNAKNVAIAAMNRGWRYSDRLQVPLFKNAWNT